MSRRGTEDFTLRDVFGSYDDKDANEDDIDIVVESSGRRSDASLTCPTSDEPSLLWSRDVSDTDDDDNGDCNGDSHAIDSASSVSSESVVSVVSRASWTSR